MGAIEILDYEVIIISITWRLTDRPVIPMLNLITESSTN